MAKPVSHRPASRLGALACLLALAVNAAWAGPIPFTETYGVSAFADVDGTSDGPVSADAPPDPLPLTASAAVAMAGGSAGAGASAASGLLGVASNATSSGGTAQASAVATFLGAFTTPAGRLALEVLDLGGVSLAGISLDVLWIIDGLTLPTTSPGRFLSGPLVAGLAGTLEITLTGNALAELPGQQDASTAAVAFSLRQVPAPGVPALLLLGLGLLGLRPHRPGRRGRVTAAA